MTAGISSLIALWADQKRVFICSVRSRTISLNAAGTR